MKKRVLSFFLVLCMAITLLPFGGVAAAYEAVFYDIDSAGEYLKNAMVKREASVEFTYYSTGKQMESTSEDDLKAYTDYLYDAIMDKVYEHTGVGCEGDYLRYSVASHGCSMEISFTEVGYEIVMSYSFEYYSTAEQEKILQSKLEEIESAANLSGKTDYEKVLFLYTYICDHVSYDYGDGLSKYSAYSALINGKAVCQGYAALLYRMLLDEGIDTRIVTGIGNAEEHAWNIIQIDDLYYLADCTWDEALFDFSWFLKGSNSFYDHIADSRTELLYAQYNISEDDYFNDKATTDLQVGDFSGLLHRGKVKITKYTGTGGDVVVPAEMNGYPVTSVAQLAFQGEQGIKSLTFSEGVMSLEPECLYSSDVESLYLPSTLRTGGARGLGGYFIECTNLKTIYVPENNEYLTVKDNVLFSKDMKTLISYPTGREAEEYVIPDGVESINDDAFNACSTIKKSRCPTVLLTSDTGHLSDAPI